MKYVIYIKKPAQAKWHKLSVSFKVKPSEFDVSLYVQQYAIDNQLNSNCLESKVQFESIY